MFTFDCGPIQLAVCPEQREIVKPYIKKKNGTQQVFKLNLSCESTGRVRTKNDSSYQ